MAKYELTFWGGHKAEYKRFHDTLEDAKAEASRILGRMENRAKKPAVIYAPDGKQHTVT